MRALRPIALALILCAVAAAAGFWAQRAQVTVRVLDERGRPVPNAEVHVGFNRKIEPGHGWGTGPVTGKTGSTDATGLCTISGRTNAGSAGVAAMKNGYYASTGGTAHPRTPYSSLVSRLVDGEWEPPDRVTEIVLKAVVDPVPMYARTLRDLEVPLEGAPVGFDLMAGDWVAPHGAGRTPDLLFMLERSEEATVQPGPYGRERTLFDVSLTLTFPNAADGIRPVTADPHGGSVLRLPRRAPPTGYEPELKKRLYRRAEGSVEADGRENRSYFLRVRTEKDDNGKILSALYGKIDGDIDLSHRGSFGLTYYLNPEPNSPNLEFDPSQNLFGELPSLERVTSP